MKTTKYILCFLSFALCALTACEQPVDDPKRDEALILTSSADTVICKQQLAGQAALQLTWTAGTNNGTGSAIAYTIDIDKAGNAFASGLQLLIGRTMDRTIVFSHDMLADTLKQAFADIQEEQFYTFEMRVRAKVVKTGDEQVSPVIKLVVKLKTPVPELYLIGDATPNGWSLERATSMLIDYDDPGHYTWSGPMYQGEFKLLTSTESWLPCYVSDETDPKVMHYRENEEDYPDFKWQIPYSGNYTIEVDTRSLNMVIISHSEPPVEETYSHIYRIGDATPGGWSWDAITELSHPQVDVFTYEGPLNAGQIKFPTEIKHDWSGEMIYAPTPDCAPAENGSYDIHTGDPDNKWLIPSAGNWSITIDIKNNTISFSAL